MNVVGAAKIPPLVRRAMDLARRTGFEMSCTAETGGLLQTLAARVHEGVAAEIGTGCGVGAAWIISGLPSGTPFVTVELDRQRAESARELFARCPNVRVLAGDWHDILAHGPFRFLFCDTAAAKRDEPERVLTATLPGGLVVLDDLTPEELWPPEWHGRPDPVREFWLNDPRVEAEVLTVNPAMQILLATRLP